MLDVPVEGGSEVKDGVEGFEADSGSGCFVIIDAEDLGKPFGNISDFVPSDVTRIVAFAFADKLAFERTLTTWNGRSGDKNENFEVRKTL